MAALNHAADAVRYLRSPAAIRERCGRVLARAEAGALTHFAYRPERLEPAARYVAQVTRAAFPDLDVPLHSRWRHFSAGGVDRAARTEDWAADTAERARCRIELAVTSVLLDAGAGGAWRYREAETGQLFARSEGLAVASFRAFAAGLFSSDPARPRQADAAGLASVTAASLGAAFQVGPGNPLAGLEGRAGLMRRLGATVAARPQVFGSAAPPRLGTLLDHLAARADGDGRLGAGAMLSVLLDALGPVWPGRVTLGGVGLGDVGRHPAARTADLTSGLVPFHKLSQWLAYSLVEPLAGAGIEVEALDELTGLPEYRNGGLLVDLGVLVPRRPALLAAPLAVEAEAVVEWRALTLALLDRLAAGVRAELGLDAARFPLARVLEGGTWRAGRQIAGERRSGGAPPFTVDSDGTVF